VSVEGIKALINSIVTPRMTFTKTSQKFGQWIDFKLNLVYGLGFANDIELNKVECIIINKIILFILIIFFFKVCGKI
jgi:hypothetical protein